MYVCSKSGESKRSQDTKKKKKKTRKKIQNLIN